MLQQVMGMLQHAAGMLQQVLGMLQHAVGMCQGVVAVMSAARWVGTDPEGQGQGSENWVWE